MSTCYRRRHVRLADTGLLERIVDAAYVLTTERSDRIDTMIHRLRRLPPYPSVVVQYNKTYKHCCKPGITTPDHDIRHAMSYCIRGALNRGERRVLIMEDDCELLPETFTTHTVKAMHDVLLQDKEADAYLFGCCPQWSTLTKDARHLRIHHGGSLHGVVWTERGMRRFLDSISTTKQRGPVDILITTMLRVYAPVRPMAVQKHPDTDNSRMWMYGFHYVLHRHIFQSHKDGRTFYRHAHLVGCLGGTYMLLTVTTTATIVAVLVVLSRRKHTKLKIL